MSKQTGVETFMKRFNNALADLERFCRDVRTESFGGESVIDEEYNDIFDRLAEEVRLVLHEITA